MTSKSGLKDDPQIFACLCCCTKKVALHVHSGLFSMQLGEYWLKKDPGRKIVDKASLELTVMQ